MSAPTPPPSRFDWFFWPNEWSRDEKFWREVATRTMAATFAALLIGLPVVIYTAATGALDWNIAAPILIGAALFLAVSYLYITALRFIHDVRDLRLIAKAIKRPEITDGMSAEELDNALTAYRSRMKSPETLAAIAGVKKRSLAQLRAMIVPAALTAVLIVILSIQPEWLQA